MVADRVIYSVGVFRIDWCGAIVTAKGRPVRGVGAPCRVMV